MTYSGIRTRRFVPFIKFPSTGNALSRLSRLKVGCVYLINSRQNICGRIINCVIHSRQVYISRSIISPFISNLILCNRLRLECPSTCEGNGSNYFISAIIGCAYSCFPTAKGVCTIVSVNRCKRVFVATIKSSILFLIFSGICRKVILYVSRDIAIPFVVDCVNLLFRCPFCGQGDIFAGGFNCFLVLVDSVLIFPTQEFIIPRGGFHLPNSVII